MNIVLTILIGLVAGWVATIIFELILKTNKKLRHRYYQHHQILFGYHVHHSTYGLLFMVAGIIFFINKNIPASLFNIAFGVGIIIEHTLSDSRFIFLEKWKP